MEKRQILVIGNDLSTYNSIKEYIQSEDADIFRMDFSAEALESFITQKYSLAIVDIGPDMLRDMELICIIGAVKRVPILAFVPPSKTCGNFSMLRGEANAHIGNLLNTIVYTPQGMDSIWSHPEIKSDLNGRDTIIWGNELLISPYYRQVFVDGKSLSLTRKEFDLLHYMARHPGQVFSHEQLYSYVWNDISEVDGSGTVKTHIKNLRKKLASTGKKYIHNVWGVGYKFVILNDD